MANNAVGIFNPIKSITVSGGKFAVSVGDAVFIASPVKEVSWKRFSIEQLFNVSYDNTFDPNLVYISGVAFCNGAFVAEVVKSGIIVDASTPYTGIVYYYLFSPDGTQQFNFDLPNDCWSPVLFELEGPLSSYPPICTFSVSISGATTWQIATGPPTQLPPDGFPICPGHEGGQDVTPPQPYTENFEGFGTGITSTTTDGKTWKTTLTTKKVSDSLGIFQLGINFGAPQATKDNFYLSITDNSPYSSSYQAYCGYPAHPFPITDFAHANFSGAPVDTVYTSTDGINWASKNYPWTGAGTIFPFPPANEPPSGLTIVSPGHNQGGKTKNGASISLGSSVVVSFPGGVTFTPNLSPMVNFYAKDILNNAFCVVGTDTGGANAYAATSPDGKIWTVTRLEAAPVQGGFPVGNFTVAAGNLGRSTKKH